VSVCVCVYIYHAVVYVLFGFKEVRDVVFGAETPVCVCVCVGGERA